MTTDERTKEVQERLSEFVADAFPEVRGFCFGYLVGDSIGILANKFPKAEAALLSGKLMKLATGD